MQARTLKIIAALLIISAIVMGVIGYKISQQDTSRAHAATTTSESSNAEITYAQKLLVVNQDLPKGSVLTEEHLELLPFPIPVDDSFAKVTDVVNKRLEYGVRKGDVIRAEHFIKKSLLAEDITEGHRAIAVDVNEVVGTGGFLVPGDYVDVIYTARAGKENYEKSHSRRVLRNVRLLAYGADIGEDLPEVANPEEAKRGQSQQKDSGKRSRSAVLEVALDDINILTLAESSGTLRLAAVGEMDIANAKAEAEREGTILSSSDEEDKATFIRSVTGIKPPAPPKSVYVYSGDKVETIRVPK
ncbi:Flp pilus assembly protein CpaB [Spongiibacter taiwanensis]|uniref:Flp pilus assembly protein CpaB n=1 Tax=Spongiibacter taiwanensis TaxID=1748242 RepID=UPI002034C1A3|nr:Flp pilus assembly protein CpaB [Spongiibacter taiwanensis]USA43590.1 Flp pilus assembly protein CpaB [Spongiibacter taiwanensis]